MSHALGPVLAHDVFHHIFAAVLVEIYVDIGHGDTFRIEETLKKKIVFDRVYIGDGKAVGHRRSGSGTTARTHRHTHIAGSTYEVPHNEKIAGKTHSLYG